MIKDVLDNAKDGPKVGERFVFRPAGRLGHHKLEFVSASQPRRLWDQQRFPKFHAHYHCQWADAA